MLKRLIIPFLTVTALAAGVWIGSGTRREAPLKSDTATLLCTANNAGIPLSDRVQVTVYAAGRPEAVASAPGSRPINVPPGRYDVQLAYTGTDDQLHSWVRNLELKAGQRYEGAARFEAGTLVVRSRGGKGKVRVQLLAARDHSKIIATKFAGEPFVVQAGRYDVRAALLNGSDEAAVQWLKDQEVKAASTTEQVAVFRRGELLVHVTNAGRDIAGGSARLFVFRAGDPQQQLLMETVPGVPLEIDEGTYDVQAVYSGASGSPQLWSRNLVVRQKETAKASLDFRTGALTVRTWMPGNEELTDFRSYVYVYGTSDHSQAVAFVPAGQRMQLPEGNYDIRAVFTRSQDKPEVWVRDVHVGSGEAVARDVTFGSSRLLVRALNGKGNEITGDNIFVTVYPVGARAAAIARARSGEAMVLTAGTYDVQLHCTVANCADQWIEKVRLEPGKRLEQKAIVASAPHSAH